MPSIGLRRTGDGHRAWSLGGRPGPVLAMAIHAGHRVRPAVRPWLALDEGTRLREEDPHTGRWTRHGDVRLTVRRSRFEVDLNRPRDRAVYRHPDEAWGLTVWKPGTPPALFEESLALYDRFYETVRAVLEDLVREVGCVVVFDLHSYNHRRDDPARRMDQQQNPDINVGTGNLDRNRWGDVVDAVLERMSRETVDGRRLDVRENVRFRGGYLVEWIHSRFGDAVCPLAIEVKKIYMDEWTGELYPATFRVVHHVLAAGVDQARGHLTRSC